MEGWEGEHDGSDAGEDVKGHGEGEGVGVGKTLVGRVETMETTGAAATTSNSLLLSQQWLSLLQSLLSSSSSLSLDSSTSMPSATISTETTAVGSSCTETGRRGASEGMAVYSGLGEAAANTNCFWYSTTSKATSFSSPKSNICMPQS